jgi:hypothetical protein
LRRIEGDSGGYLEVVKRVVASIALAVALGGCGGDASDSTLDLNAGTYGGVGLGSAAADIRARFGGGESAPNGPAAPLGSEFSEIGGAISIPLPHGGRVEDRDILRYDDVAFLLADDRVFALVVTAGAEIGHSLREVSRGRSLRCGVTSGGGEYREYPYCVGRVADHFVWYGEDPVRSITLSETSLLGGA